MMIEILNGVVETVAFREQFGIRLYLNVEAEDYPIHWHTAGEIIMPLENIYTVVVNDITYVLNPGDIMILPSGEIHQLYAPDNGKRIILQFDSSMLYQLKGFDSSFHLFRPCLVITSDDNYELHQKLKQLVLSMKEEYFSQEIFKEASTYSHFIQFFVTLGRNHLKQDNHFSQVKSSKQHIYIEKFLEVCHYINQHCTEEIPLDKLADIAGFSKFHFARMFKQIMGITYYNYLIQHRILHAENLLIDPKLSIMDVAMRSGFGSLPTFNRVFKSYKKCTPSEFKNLHGVYTPTILPIKKGQTMKSHVTS
ncbi:AraC family transcriptional regulator [Paenibacillus endoradicis]|uniref:AraC family transcriptional regulator n=1 Tax=Paenibacillus endoradicis TaxID=2972487 RepID=UPI002158F0B4|nr:AraC family transcriptional regulator [Paenibacillus endoradicis]MCR8660643.1 AraC family transcriptional regulator [Paenibacillus endoradicis]